MFFWEPLLLRTIQEKQKKCKRKIIWCSLPFSTNSKTNIGKMFFNLLCKHFPKTNNLCKIFSKNTVKISYSCMRNSYSQEINSTNLHEVLMIQKTVHFFHFITYIVKKKIVWLTLFDVIINTRNLSLSINLIIAKKEFKWQHAKMI